MNWKLLATGALGFAGSALAGAYAARATNDVAQPPAVPANVQFVTGADPIDPAEYDQLPKVGKYRAWLPKKVDLSENFPKPGYQGPQPDCVAWATTYAARSFLHGRETGRQPTDPGDQMSPAYVYNRLRVPGSMCDRPVRVVDALRLLQREGSVTLADFPDDIASCNVPAPASLLEKASQFRLDGWRAINREVPGVLASPIVVDDIKGALSRGEPVVFAMPAASDFMALRGDAIYTHEQRENTNWHAMAVVGYDEDRQAFRVINSWGQWWGDGGYAWIGYPTFKLLVREAYALQDNPHHSTGPAPAPVADPKADFDKLASNLPCGRVSSAMVRGRLTVSGFGGSEDSLAALHKAAVAVTTNLDWRVDLHPWPQCEGELTLSDAIAGHDVGLIAQSADGRARPGNPVRMVAGEIFGISADVPAGKPWLSLVYLQADGSAVELWRGSAKPAAGKAHSVTIGLAGARAAQFKVGPPYGDEMVIALASSRPLFGDELRDYATERQFLTALRAKLTTVPSSSVSAAVMRIHTSE